MAYYEHLPIYKKAMETAVYFENIVRNFSRYNKYNLGAEMRTKSRDIVKLIIKANSSRNKLPFLTGLRFHFQIPKTFQKSMGWNRLLKLKYLH